MIDKQFGELILTCDICGDSVPRAFTKFDGAVQYKKDNGWKSQKSQGEWEDVCPECQGVEQ